MAPTALYIDIYNKEGDYIGTITDWDLGVTDVTVGQVLNTSLCVNNGITEVSSTHGGEPLSHDADVRGSAGGGSDRAHLHDVTPEVVSVETITCFYLDGTEYRFEGGGSQISYVTQTEYDALPNTKLTDGVSYIIYEDDGGGE